MARYFFPGCKVKKAYPRECSLLLEYLEARFAADGGLQVAGCCRQDTALPTANDDVVFICNNCHEILSESAQHAELVSVWELMDADAQLQLPDYGGEEMAVQDCWIASTAPQVRQAVRSLLGKMNIKVVELERNGAESTFCGHNLCKPVTGSNKQLAPKRWVELAEGVVGDMTEEEMQEHFEAHALTVPTQRAACYCKFCADGLRAGGKEPLHMLQLIFPAE